MERYTELEVQRRHLLEQTTPEGRKMIMSGINRLLDQMTGFSEVTPTNLPPSAEGQAHLNKQTNHELGCE